MLENIHLASKNHNINGVDVVVVYSACKGFRYESPLQCTLNVALSANMVPSTDY